MTKHIFRFEKLQNIEIFHIDDLICIEDVENNQMIKIMLNDELIKLIMFFETIYEGKQLTRAFLNMLKIPTFEFGNVDIQGGINLGSWVDDVDYSTISKTLH